MRSTTRCTGADPAGPRLRESLEAAIFSGNARDMLALGDRSNFRRDDGSYDQINYSFPAVRCLDSQDDSVREAEKRDQRVAKAAPVLGPLGGADLTCALWPVAPAPPQPSIDGDGAPPIVVIGTTGDPATPYEYAVDMADRLKSGVLVTNRGEGHLAYGSGECINRLVIDYPVQDRVPTDRTRWTEVCTKAGEVSLAGCGRASEHPGACQPKRDRPWPASGSRSI